MLFEESSKDRVHAVKRESRGAHETLGQLTKRYRFFSSSVLHLASQKRELTFAGALVLRCGVLRVPPPRRLLDRVSRFRENMRMSVRGGFEEARKAERRMYFCKVGRERVIASTFLSSTLGPSFRSDIRLHARECVLRGRSASSAALKPGKNTRKRRKRTSSGML